MGKGGVSPLTNDRPKRKGERHVGAAVFRDLREAQWHQVGLQLAMRLRFKGESLRGDLSSLLTVFQGEEVSIGLWVSAARARWRMALRCASRVGNQLCKRFAVNW